MASQLMDNATSTPTFRPACPAEEPAEELSGPLSSASSSPKSGRSASVSFAVCFATWRVVTPIPAPDDGRSLRPPRNSSCRLATRLRSDRSTRRFRLRPMTTDRFATDFGKSPVDVGVAAWLLPAPDSGSLFQDRGENRTGVEDFARLFLSAGDPTEVFGSGRLNPCDRSISAS